MHAAPIVHEHPHPAVPSCSSIHVYAIPGVASCEYRSLYESVKRRARSEASFWSPSPSFSRSRSLGQKKAACLSVTQPLQPSVEPVVTFSATAHTHEFRRNPPPHTLHLLPPHPPSPPSLLATRANRRGGRWGGWIDSIRGKVVVFMLSPCAVLRRSAHKACPATLARGSRRLPVVLLFVLRLFVKGVQEQVVELLHQGEIASASGGVRIHKHPLPWHVFWRGLPHRCSYISGGGLQNAMTPSI